MKLASFSYQRPTALADAVQLISDQSRDIRLIAGGQSLLAALNFRLGEPDLLVDLNQIKELAGISSSENIIRIGAMTRHHEVLTSDLIAQQLPLLARAMREVAHPAIRNRGTLGGSIALADPAAEMPACVLAYNATIIARGADGQRRIRADEYFRGLYETAIEPGEIIEAIEFVSPSANSFYAFEEFARRQGDFATAGVAITGENVANVGSIRVVLFGVADKPVRANAVEDALSGQALTEQSIKDAANLATEGIAVFSDGQTTQAMKRHLAKTLIVRSLTQVLANG